jgi:hypothetical protein
MKSPRYVPSILQLARAINYSPTHLYFLRKLDGAPQSNGKGHSVAAWRAFAKRNKGKLKSDERTELEIQCLRLKAERLEHELAESRESSRSKAREEMKLAFIATMQFLHSACYRVRVECSPAFEGKSASEIFKLWGERERDAFNATADEIVKRVGGHEISEADMQQAPDNVVEFQRKAVAR